MGDVAARILRIDEKLHKVWSHPRPARDSLGVFLSCMLHAIRVCGLAPSFSAHSID
jgi:hypothetical protein